MIIDGLVSEIHGCIHSYYVITGNVENAEEFNQLTTNFVLK